VFVDSNRGEVAIDRSDPATNPLGFDAPASTVAFAESSDDDLSINFQSSNPLFFFFVPPTLDPAVEFAAGLVN